MQKSEMKGVLCTFSGLKMRIRSHLSSQSFTDNQLPTKQLKQTLQMEEESSHPAAAQPQRVLSLRHQTERNSCCCEVSSLQLVGQAFPEVLLCFNSSASSCSHQFCDAVPNPGNKQYIYFFSHSTQVTDSSKFIQYMFMVLRAVLMAPTLIL